MEESVKGFSAKQQWFGYVLLCLATGASSLFSSHIKNDHGTTFRRRDMGIT
jgi:hypothetical protein